MKQKRQRTESKNKILIKNSDSKNMEKELYEGEVDLTVTSPPYRNAINYNKHLDGKYYRGNGTYTTEKYLEDMKLHFNEVFRVTKEGGVCAIVVGNELDSEERSIVPLPAYFTSLMMKIGWIFHEEIIWYKVTGGKRRFGVTVQNPYPTYYYPNILHEKILIFRKGQINHVKKEESKIIINELLKKEVANSVWHIAPVPPNYLDHPTPFPEDLVYRLLLLYSNKGDIILDPFNGSGTTTKVAYKTGRSAIGYDIIEKYCKIAKGRLKQPLNLRDPLIPKWNKSKQRLKSYSRGEMENSRKV